MNDVPSPTGRRPQVLLVEDNDNDIELTRLAFDVVGAAIDLHCVRDGEQCMRYLETADPSARPDLILLDLHMPRMDGLEVLQALARDDAFKRIPVVVLTTSDAPDDVDAAYRLGCNSYVLKPIGFEPFAKLIGDLTRYWFGLVTLPLGGAHAHHKDFATRDAASSGAHP
jgi:two-component system response regulator